jgi:N-acetylneuraminic acid mutarotase
MRFLLAALLVFSAPPVHIGWTALPPLPSAVTNNAVASYVHKDRTLIYSFMGLGKEKTYDTITTNAMVFDSRHDEWRMLPPVPGKSGRIAATAVVVDGDVYLLGGYKVGADGKQSTVSDVDIYTPGPDEPTQGYWAKGVPTPIPVDDAVAAVYENRYIMLISGWSKDDNVANIQIYDTWHDHWRPGNVIVGKPVFGHAGVIVNRTIVYCGGAYKNPEHKTNDTKPKYVASNECWQGKITGERPFKIEWTQLPPHPGNAQYRMAAGIWGKRAVFTGGTDNPYNFDGIGYDGKPSSPSAITFAWNTETNAWETLPQNPEPAMDQRAMAPDKEGLVVVGGMEAGQKVVKRVAHLSLQK